MLTGSYNAAGLLAGFDGLAPDGPWTLFFADEVSGGGTSTLNSWSLDISTVPEPGITGLALLGALMFGGIGRCGATRYIKTVDPGAGAARHGSAPPKYPPSSASVGKRCRRYALHGVGH